MKIIAPPQSGSQADTTSSKNRFGQYTRNRRSPVNVNSPAQRQTRANLSNATKLWAGLTDAAREAWKSYAAQHPRVDSLGQTITLTGHQMFVSVCNIVATCFGGSVVAVPNLPTPSLLGLNLTTTSVTDVSISITVGSPDEIDAIVVRTSPPMSAGRSFNGDMRIVAVKTAVATGGIVLATAALVNKWGSLSAGQKFFISATPVMLDGTVGSDVTAQIVLT